MILQSMVILLIQEPYPAFSFPSFGLGKEALADSNPIDERISLLAVNTNDTLNLTEVSFLSDLSTPQLKALCRRLSSRSNKRLNRDNQALLTRIMYRKYLEPTPRDVHGLKHWIAEEFGFTPTALVIQKEQFSIKSGNTLVTTKQEMIEVFE